MQIRVWSSVHDMPINRPPGCFQTVSERRIPAELKIRSFRRADSAYSWTILESSRIIAIGPPKGAQATLLRLKSMCFHRIG